MKKKMINQTHIEGLLYENDLKKKVSGNDSKNPGTEYISGSVSIATDNACMNVVTIYYTYVTATTKSGGVNSTYTTLEKILDGAKCVTKDGKDEAVRVSADSSIGLNEFYSDRNGNEELVSTRRNSGGFIHISNDPLNEDEGERATFEADMLITNTYDVEANPERGIQAKLAVKGYIFDFRNGLLPVEFSVYNPDGIRFISKFECSPKNPVFTKVWGTQVSQTTYREIIEESGFGGTKVTRKPTVNKDFVMKGILSKDAMRDNGYIWDTEEAILATEFIEALQNREIYLATIKQRQDDYKASKKTATKPTMNATAGNYGF